MYHIYPVWEVDTVINLDLDLGTFQEVNAYVQKACVCLQTKPMFKTHFYFIIKTSELHNRKYALFCCSLSYNFYVKWWINFHSAAICD